MKRVTLNLTDETFALLEVLAIGLARENNQDIISNKQNDNFSPMVSGLLSSVADSLSTGIIRPGSWERDILYSLTGWNNTYVPAMVDDCVKSYFPDEAE